MTEKNTVGFCNQRFGKCSQKYLEQLMASQEQGSGKGRAIPSQAVPREGKIGS